MSDLPPTCREVRLAARPEGLPGPEHFVVVEVPLPLPGPDQVLVRNRFFRVSASLRMMIGQGAEDVTGVPFPALRPGDTVLLENPAYPGALAIFAGARARILGRYARAEGKHPDVRSGCSDMGADACG